MFTGLVQQIGSVRNVRRGAKGATVHIVCAFEQLELGESIAIDGACLTVARIAQGGYEAFASLETLEQTTLSRLKSGERVHLERAARMGDAIGGHFVTGHIDGTGSMVDRRPLGESVTVTFEVPSRLARFVAPKGSVAVDGVSLTVNEVRNRRFEVVLVPYTLKETTFDERPLGSPVNIEVDVLAKYVAQQLGRTGVDESGGASASGEDPPS